MTQKKTLDYWIKRQTIDMYRQMDKAEVEAAEVAKVYGEASGYVSNKLEEIFERYKSKHNLTETEARRLIVKLQNPTDIEEALRELKNGQYTTNKEDVLAKIESQAYGNRIERLQQMNNELDLMMQSVYNQERIHTSAFYKDLANEAYYKSMFNIQQQANATFGFSKLDPRVVERVLKANWAGKSYSQRIWGNTHSLARTLKRELLVSLLTGKTNFEVQKVVENKFLAGASKARRLIRTESNYISGEMNFLAYEDAGLKKYRFVATLDLRTSKKCRALDNKVFLMKNRKVGVNCHPMHPWCRSTTVAYINDYDLRRMERSARDPITGRTIRVPADMAYEQWYKQYVENNHRYQDKVEQEKFDKRYLAKSTDERLPNHSKAVIPNEKIEGYALNKDHIYGRDKAIAFEKFLGYNVSNKEQLVAEIRRGVSRYKSNPRKETKYGTPYSTTMRMKGANGEYARVKAAWQLDTGKTTPRLVSVYVDE